MLRKSKRTYIREPKNSIQAASKSKTTYVTDDIASISRNIFSPSTRMSSLATQTKQRYTPDSGSLNRSREKNHDKSNDPCPSLIA